MVTLGLSAFLTVLVESNLTGIFVLFKVQSNIVQLTRDYSVSYTHLDVYKRQMFTIVSLEVLKYWNNYLMTQFILTRQQMRTIQIAMMSLFNEALFSWDVAVAAVTLSILPLFIFFVIAQKQVLSSATVGAVKG